MLKTKTYLFEGISLEWQIHCILDSAFTCDVIYVQAGNIWRS